MRVNIDMRNKVTFNHPKGTGSIELLEKSGDEPVVRVVISRNKFIEPIVREYSLVDTINILLTGRVELCHNDPIWLYESGTIKE